MNDANEITLLPKSEVISRLRERHISPTQQRVEIAQILLSKHQHLSAAQVLEMVNREKNKVSKATVYNTLGLFARKGLVRELIVDPTKVFYDSNTDEHHHFYNVDTGELIDINRNEISVGELPHLPEGTARDGMDVIVRIRQTAQAVGM
jgi:Fur family iron response transcriptional regulator